jgi:hypothetical protein
MNVSKFCQAVWIVAMTSAGIGATHADSISSNKTPLSFGISADDASRALGVPLQYIKGRPGDETYLAVPNVKGSIFSSRLDGLYLQFRRGRLEGWKGDWAINPPCCN